MHTPRVYALTLHESEEYGTLATASGQHGEVYSSWKTSLKKLGTGRFRYPLDELDLGIDLRKRLSTVSCIFKLALEEGLTSVKKWMRTFYRFVKVGLTTSNPNYKRLVRALTSGHGRKLQELATGPPKSNLRYGKPCFTARANAVVLYNRELRIPIFRYRAFVRKAKPSYEDWD